MAAIPTSYLTLADWAKRVDPDGTIPVIAELLSQTNEILEDCIFKEGNLPTGERVTIRTGLPTVYWRAMNQGTPPSKSSTAQVDENCGMLEARSEVDTKLAQLNGNTAEFRLSESVAFLEAMNQKQGQTMFYGNPASDPKEYLGLSARYSVLGATNGQNILSAGGSTNLTSVWLVVWGRQGIYCTFPKGSKAGLTHRDLGEQTVYNPNGENGTRMQALCDLYQWDNGLVVKDWRHGVRICNIDTAALIAGTGTQGTNIAPSNPAMAATHVIKLMARAISRIPNINAGRAVFYANRTVHSGLQIAAMDRTQNVLSIEDGLSQFGSPMRSLMFQKIPVRLCDQLLNTETAVA